MTRRRITLQSGDELIVNGYHVRATGSPRKGTQYTDGTRADGKASSLQIYRPEQGFNARGENDHRMLYAGLADDVLCLTSIAIGDARTLALSLTGWPKAIHAARVALGLPSTDGLYHLTCEGCHRTETRAHARQSSGDHWPCRRRGNTGHGLRARLMLANEETE
jgi:hypothetical protein